MVASALANDDGKEGLIVLCRHHRGIAGPADPARLKSWCGDEANEEFREVGRVHTSDGRRDRADDVAVVACSRSDRSPNGDQSSYAGAQPKVFVCPVCDGHYIEGTVGMIPLPS